MSRLGRTLGSIVTILTLPALTAAQLLPTPPPLATGTGIIVGQVIDAATGRGVSSAVVTRAGARRVMTTTDGRFAFRSLPAGSHSLTAAKSGYIDGAYGMRRPGGPTLPIVLADGERRGNLVIWRWKHGAITGTIVDETGEPLTGIQVTALRRSIVGGRRRFVQSGVGTTDDRDMYRIARLAPGDYAVAMTTSQVSVPSSVARQYEESLMAGGDLNRSPLFQAMMQVGAMPSMMGSTESRQVGDEVQSLGRGVPTPPPADGPRLFAYPSLFYPAALSAASAAMVSLASGQERTGIDLRNPRRSEWRAFFGRASQRHAESFCRNGSADARAGGQWADRRSGAIPHLGLAAGDYVISANAGFASQMRDNEIARLTDADIKRAMSEVASRAARPGSPSSTAADPGPRPRTVGYASVFYPGTPVATQAVAIKLGVAEERTGVDFPLSLVPTAKVEGSVVVPEGMNPQSIMIQMIGSNPQGLMLDLFRRSTPTAEGTFTFAGAAPGPYAIVAQAAPPAPPGGRPMAPSPVPRQPSHWARADVTIDGLDISGVSLTLQPGMVVAGRVQLEGTSAQPPDLSRIRINLLPVQASGEVSFGQLQIQPDATGAFSVAGVTPGRYRLMASIPSPRPDSAWQLKSSVMFGRDTLDSPVDLREGTDSAVITFTDRTTELAGTIQDAGGQPAPEYHVVVFARDKAFWTAQSRRIRTVRPAADGKYVMPNLPPGEYLMTAVTDMEPGEWFDPAFLEMLSRSAIALTIGDGEKKTQDLRLAAQLP